jgi:four helix bundle protein
MSNIRSYRDLDVWQRSVEFAVFLYGLTDGFPPSEDYGLTSQMRRAAVSIASNIAEGHARPGREFGRFLGIALGSVAELETQLEIAHRLNHLTAEDYSSATGELDVIGKQLRRLMQRVRK